MNNFYFILIVIAALVALFIILFLQYKQRKKANRKSISDVEIPIEDEYVIQSMNEGFNYKKTLRTYHMSLSKIEKAFALSNGDFSSMTEKKLENFFSSCSKNILNFRRLRDYEGNDLVRTVDNVPSYYYLSLVYEYRKDYINAINACATALKYDACTDDKKELMKERILNLSEESGLTLSNKIKELLE